MSGEGRQIKASCSHQMEECLQVPLFGPSNVTRRVVVSPLLILGVIASGTVGAGHDKLRLLEVERPSREVEADGTKCDHSPLMANSLGGQANWGIGRRGGCDEDRICADSSCKFGYIGRFEIRLGGFGPHAEGKFALPSVRIGPNDAAAVSLKE